MPQAPSPTRRQLLLAGAGALVIHRAAPAAGPVPAGAPIRLEVDATDTAHRVLRMRQRLAAPAGPLRLQLPRWLPGTHGPYGDVTRLAGLVAQLNGQPLAWRRDPLQPDVFAFELPSAGELELRWQHLAPLARDQGRVSITPRLLGIQWIQLVLHPEGRASAEIAVAARLKLPEGFTAAGALREIAQADGWIDFAPVSLETLMDSPLFAGRHVRRVALDAPGAARPVTLHVFADEPAALAATESQLAAHRALVREADALFGARHFDHYDFLLALSDEFGGIGLEHHQSSENAVPPDYFKDWDKGIRRRELLPHEYVHSWNGKFRRPLDLWTPEPGSPMGGSLLWVYEGQTEFWGRVLTARAGLATPEQTRDLIARVAANHLERTGRVWRSLQDTTTEPALGRRGPKEWPDWQRDRGDYYSESMLMWLDVDARLRELTGGARSMDDFARAFFGVADGRMVPLTYRFDDVAAGLRAVSAGEDWTAFLRRRLDAQGGTLLIDGLSRAGWQLAWVGEESAFARHDRGREPLHNLAHSLGLVLGREGRVSRVVWEGPAWQAGFAPTQQLVAVGGRAYTVERLNAAIEANRGGAQPLALLVRDGDDYRELRLDWRGGQRFPRLVRKADTPDRLSALLAPRVQR